MLVRPTLPLVPTIIDVRLRRPEGSYNDALFSGWGIEITGTRRVL